MASVSTDFIYAAKRSIFSPCSQVFSILGNATAIHNVKAKDESYRNVTSYEPKNAMRRAGQDQ